MYRVYALGPSFSYPQSANTDVTALGNPSGFLQKKWERDDLYVFTKS